MAPRKRAAPKRSSTGQAATPVSVTQQEDRSLSPLSELGSSSPPSLPPAPAPLEDAGPANPSRNELESPFLALRDNLTTALQSALAKLVQRRQLSAPAPALTPDQVQQLIAQVQQACGDALQSAHPDDEPLWRKEARRGIVYTALEELVFDVAMNHTVTDLATENNNDPSPFALLVDVLDLVLAFSEQGYAESNLPLTCIASVLDMQTISGCFHIFAYLESRFERLTADMHPSKGKGLILLRLLNDLLRRLPKLKNDDIIFCGRILLFLSSAFPVGEKSGVNLRGNFNLGKVIGFEEKPVVEEAQPMDVDEATGDDKSKVDKPDVAKDDFYSVFWSLQKYFINPQSLFAFPPSPATPPLAPAALRSDPSRTGTSAAPSSVAPSSSAVQIVPAPAAALTPPPAEGFPALRAGLVKTLEVFRDHTRKEREVTSSSSSSHSGAYSSSSSNRSERDRKKMSAYERGDINDEQEFSETTQSYFFPKFLTSRNLLSLELADPAFRRQILVQALILFQYLLAFIPNGHLSSLIVTQKLGAVDEAWIKEMRVKVTMELESMGGGGKLFRGTVELILRREQNWINWKLQGCQLITKPPIDAVSTSATAKSKLATLTRKPKAWPYPLGNPTLSKLWEKNLTKLNGETVIPEESFDGLVRSWKMTNRIINQRNAMLNNARAALAIEKTDTLVETEDGLVRELEQLHQKSKVLHWRAIRMASTVHLHLFHLIKSGNLALLLSAIDAERIKLAEKEEAAAQQLADQLAAEAQGELPDRGTPELEGAAEEDESLLSLEPAESNASNLEMTSRDHSRINTPLRQDDSIPSSRAPSPKPTLDDLASPAKRNRDEMEVDEELTSKEQESKRVKSEAGGRIAEEKQEQEEVAAALGL